MGEGESYWTAITMQSNILQDVSHLSLCWFDDNLSTCEKLPIGSPVLIPTIE